MRLEFPHVEHVACIVDVGGQTVFRYVMRWRHVSVLTSAGRSSGHERDRATGVARHALATAVFAFLASPGTHVLRPAELG